MNVGASPQAQLQAGMTMYITALIVEHCDLDAIAEVDAGKSFTLHELGIIEVVDHLGAYKRMANQM